MTELNCHKCIHQRNIPGDVHIRCENDKAIVKGHRVGINGGWFNWPYNFDPNWLLSCDSFQSMLDVKVINNE